MQANIHAVLLVGLAAGSLVALVLLSRRTPKAGQFGVALGVAFLGTLAAPVLNHHLCWEGEPLTQWLVLGPCFLLIIAFVKSLAWRRVLGALVFVGMHGLSCHFTELVHTPGWTGNPAWDGGASIAKRSLNQAISIAIDGMPDPRVEYPAGWLRDLPVWTAIDCNFHAERQPARRRQIQPVWHSSLTGLYRYTTIDLDYWYPGGPFAESGPRTELRDRPLR
jgi:hypothetical protein